MVQRLALPLSFFVSTRVRPHTGTFVMALIILTLGFYLVYPVVLLLVYSFNTAPSIFLGAREWGLDNWVRGFQEPRIFRALGNSFLIWGMTYAISFPIAVAISWALGRVRVPFNHGLELMFWISYMMPGISTTISWITLMDPQIGILNRWVTLLPFIEQGPFNIFSVPGIVWAHVMANGISLKVMLLTPAFRNMDASLEEAGRVSGASNLRTMLKVTVPLMASPLALVTALQLVRIFQSFETEFLLGMPFGFYVYSTLIYELVRFTTPPAYGQATVLASLTLLVIAAIIPLQRWILTRRRYTTLTGNYKPGLLDLGRWNYVIFAVIGGVLFLLTVMPVGTLILGSFMTRMGYFQLDPLFTLRHWQFVLGERLFLTGLRTTLILAGTAAVVSPILFSILGYILVRTRWRGRGILDSIIWISAAVPGILSGLGLLLLFLGTPGLSFLYATIWALIIVVIIQGNTTGVNLSKAAIVQIGQDMEEAARLAGAGWVRTYFKIWVPLLMPTLILLGTLNFVVAAGTTAPIILLASRGTITLSILALEYASPGIGLRSAASIVSIILMALTVGVALVARYFGLQVGIHHDRPRR